MCFGPRVFVLSQDSSLIVPKYACASALPVSTIRRLFGKHKLLTKTYRIPLDVSRMVAFDSVIVVVHHTLVLVVVHCIPVVVHCTPVVVHYKPVVVHYKPALVQIVVVHRTLVLVPMVRQKVAAVLGLELESVAMLVVGHMSRMVLHVVRFLTRLVRFY